MILWRAAGAKRSKRRLSPPPDKFFWRNGVIVFFFLSSSSTPAFGQRAGGDRYPATVTLPRCGELGNAGVRHGSACLPYFPSRGTFSLEVSALCAQGQTLVWPLPIPAAMIWWAQAPEISVSAASTARALPPIAARDPLAISVAADDTLATLAAKITRESGAGAVNAYVRHRRDGGRAIGAEGRRRGG